MSPIWRCGCPSFRQAGVTSKEKKSMSEYQETRIEAATPRWVGLAIAALGGISLIGLGLGWSAMSKSSSVEQSTQASLKQQNDALSQRLAKEEEQNQQLQSDLKLVTEKLTVTQKDLVKA